MTLRRMSEDWEKHIITGDPLTKEQQEKLDKVKVETAVGNEKYLRDHPEIQRMIEVYIRTLLESRPENPVKFTADFFCSEGLKENVMAAWQPEDSYNEQ